MQFYSSLVCETEPCENSQLYESLKDLNTLSDTDEDQYPIFESPVREESKALKAKRTSKLTKRFRRTIASSKFDTVRSSSAEVRSSDEFTTIQKTFQPRQLP